MKDVKYPRLNAEIKLQTTAPIVNMKRYTNQQTHYMVSF